MNNLLQIKITNIHPLTSDDELEGLFADFGEVEEVLLGEEPEPGKRTFAAIITMGSASEATEAFSELKGEWVDGNQLKLEWYAGEDDEDESQEESNEDDESDDDKPLWEIQEDDWEDLDDKDWDKPEEPRKMR